MPATAQRKPGNSENAPKAAPKQRRPTAETTGKKQRGVPFKPGAEWKGNAAGRPKGARNVISQRFIEDMLQVWNEPNEAGDKTGIAAIREIAKTRPGQFITAMGNLVPREFAIDDETAEGFAGVWAALAKASASKDE